MRPPPSCPPGLSASRRLARGSGRSLVGAAVFGLAGPPGAEESGVSRFALVGGGRPSVVCLSGRLSVLAREGPSGGARPGRAGGRPSSRVKGRKAPSVSALGLGGACGVTGVARRSAATLVALVARKGMRAHRGPRGATGVRVPCGGRRWTAPARFSRPPSLCVALRWRGCLGVLPEWPPCQLHGSWLPIVRAVTQRRGVATWNFSRP